MLAINSNPKPQEIYNSLFCCIVKEVEITLQQRLGQVVVYLSDWNLRGRKGRVKENEGPLL